MTGNGGRVPFTFPMTVKSNQTDRFRQQVPKNGTIERVLMFFPVGTRTDLRLTLVAGGEPINEAEATGDSPPIGDYIIGSGTTYDFDTSIEVFEGQTVGVDAENVSGSSDLDGFVTFSIDYAGGEA